MAAAHPHGSCREGHILLGRACCSYHGQLLRSGRRIVGESSGQAGRRSGFQEDVTGRPMRHGASAGQRDREDLSKIGPSHSSGHSSINGLHVAYNTPGQPALYIRTSVFGRQRPQYSRPKTGFSIENPPRVVVSAAAPEKRLNR
jgi:hypothetical protein